MESYSADMIPPRGLRSACAPRFPANHDARRQRRLAISAAALFTPGSASSHTPQGPAVPGLDTAATTVDAQALAADLVRLAAPERRAWNP